MNQVQLIGRIVRDVTLQTVGQDQKKIVRNAIAVNNYRHHDKNANFIPIIAWNQRAQLMADYLQKGDKVGIVGHLHSYHYENQQGQTVHALEVVISELTFLRKKQNQSLTFDDLVGNPDEKIAQ